MGIEKTLIRTLFVGAVLSVATLVSLDQQPIPKTNKKRIDIEQTRTPETKPRYVFVSTEDELPIIGTVIEERYEKPPKSYGTFPGSETFPKWGIHGENFAPKYIIKVKVEDGSYACKGQTLEVSVFNGPIKDKEKLDKEIGVGSRIYFRKGGNSLPQKSLRTIWEYDRNQETSFKDGTTSGMKSAGDINILGKDEKIKVFGYKESK